MKRTILLSLMVIVALTLSACGVDSADGSANYSPEEKASISSFAQCLTDAGAAMYGAEWCSHCKAQKALFGDSFEDVLYYECTVEVDACNAAGIEGYPTWVVDGKKYPGEQSFQTLGVLTGCEVPTI
ncbi:hypothetical protein JXA48_03505 [Candidatus Woesearchaeota archaeon]|nr:hypothetical protein [Candidatus Woesearchaeota archaeon]